MIKFCFVVVLVMAMMSCNTASQTTIGVHVEGGKADVKSRLITPDSTYEFMLDSTSSAKIVLAGKSTPGYAKLKYGSLALPVYIEPGKDFDVSVKMEGRKATPYFTGEGAKVNEYLNGNQMRFSPDFEMGEAEFMVSLADREKVLYESLDTMGFDQTFNQLEKKRLHYMLYSVLPMYPLYHPYYAQDTAYQTSEDLYNTVRTAITEEGSLIGMEEYQEAVAGLVNVFVSREKNLSGLESAKKRLEYIQNNFSDPVVVSYLVDFFITTHVTQFGIEDLGELSPVHNAKVSDPAKKAAFEELCAKWAKIAKGQPSPDFKYLDINGQEVSLASLAGKYVYVDVWATWCGPCRGEIPSLKELEHKLQGKNICFVSISCDQDKAAWETMVKDEKLGGIQLHNGGDRDFMTAYMINGIPRFILLDREGKIVDAKMSRPSSPKTLETLNALEGI